MRHQAKPREIRRLAGRRSILLRIMSPNWPGLIKHNDADAVSRIESIGFRLGDKGTQTSRTMMLSELVDLLGFIEADSPRVAYARAIVDDNVLGKNTFATRKLTSQRLSELYSFDLAVPLYRVFRWLWERDRYGRPLLTLLLALARDPLLRATSNAVLKLTPGEELGRQSMTDAVRQAVADRLNDSTLDKVVRNAASSWTQSGHLEGRSRKFRQTVNPTPAAAAYAVFLGYALGQRGEGLLRSKWMQILDLQDGQAGALAFDAKRLGLLDMSRGGGITEISFGSVLTSREKELIHGTD